MRPYRSFLMWTGAMIALAIMVAGRVDGRQLGVVNFSNGASTPQKIPAGLVAQAQSAAKGRGNVILLRGGASPIGSRSYNFVLSGERTAAIRNRLVAAGIPRRKIASQFVGIVHRGSPTADRQVIVDATTRAALGMAAPATGQTAALNRLEGQVQALEAAAHKAKALPKTVPVKVAKVARNWVGSAFYLTRTASVNSVTTIPSFSSPTTQSESYGDTYNSNGFGFSLARRPFSVWGLPIHFGVRGVSQQWQITNPVLAGTTVASMTPGGYMIRPLQARDAVATQFIQMDLSAGMDAWGVTVDPGFSVGWLGAQSLAGGETTPAAGCAGPSCVTYVNLASTNGSSIRVTPSLKIGLGPVALSYSQSPWGTAGFNAPRVIMGQVDMGRVMLVKMGMALPDCPSVCRGGDGITNGKIVSLTLQKWGWGLNLTDVMGERFTSGGATVPATLAQVMAPFNPSRPWNSYNPGTTVSVSKRLTHDVRAVVSYGLESESGMGISAQTNGLGTVQTSSTIKTEEISLRGRF